MRFLDVTVPQGTANIELFTRYLDGWGPVQDDLAVQIEGAAETRQKAVEALAKPLTQLISVMALSGNAWVGALTTREGARSARTEAVPRELDDDATAALAQRISGHPEADKLWVAAACYRQAMGLWGPGEQVSALAALHQGFLDLSEVFVSFLAETQGVSRSGLAKSFGVSSGNLADLVLKMELYRNDGASFFAAQSAWRDVAMHEEEMNPYSIEDAFLLATVRYFRQAVFRLVELEEPYLSRLLGAPYETPLGLGQALVVGQEPVKEPRGRVEFEPGLET
jgi:hypothetical protein